MKSRYMYTPMLLLIVLMVAFSSCSKMNDLHDEYLQRGETIYVGKPDSVEVFAGKERVKFRYWLSDPKAEKLIVYWLSRTDSIVIDVPSHERNDSVEFIIPDLPEYNYSFELFTTNKDFGNRSISFQTSGSAYGERFQASLLNRVMEYSRFISKEEVEIKWLGAIERGVGCELLYTNKEGEEVRRFVPMNEQTTWIDDMKGDDLSYRTLFLPEETAIDTFYTDYKPVEIEKPTELELDKSTFKRWNPTGIPYSEYAAAYAIENLWNGSPTEFYLQKAGNGFPHSFTFDMGQTVRLKRFMHWQRLGANIAYRIQNVKKFELWGSASPDVTDDFSGWVKLGDYELTKPSGLPWGEESPEDVAYATAGESFTIDPNAPPVRYIRYVVKDSWDGAQAVVAIGEMTFFSPFE